MKVLTAHPGTFEDQKIIDSQISFAPFVRFLKTKVAEGNDARTTQYKEIIRKFEAEPATLAPMPYDTDLSRFQEYLDIVVASVFPVTIDTKHDIYGVGVPFRFALLHYSDMFRQIFTGGGDQLATVPVGVSIDKVKNDKMEWLYKLILERVYNFPVTYKNEIIHTFVSPMSGLKKFVKVHIDPQFVDVKVKGKLPTLDYNTFCNCTNTVQTLQELLPLDLFTLEGFVIWTVQDVTKEETTNRVKNLVLNMREENEVATYERMGEILQIIAESKDASAHITPFPEVNNHPVLESRFCENSPILGISGNNKQQQQLFAQLLEHAQKHPEPLVIPEVTDDILAQYPFLKFLPRKRVKSFVLCPLYHEDKLLGVLELASPKENSFSLESLGTMYPVYSLVIMLLKKSMELLKNRVTNVIKQQFTALQPAVEWKFMEAAWQYLSAPEEERKDIDNITFNDVYPLYGAVDIRNSSTERSNAIHEDLQEQLELIGRILTEVHSKIHLPLLEELLYKNKELIASTRVKLQAEDEIRVNDYLEHEISPLFRHLQQSHPDLSTVLEQYFTAVDQTEGHVLHHRQEYEESLARINTVLGQFFDKEKDQIQLSFPCYFEKYRTDGVEYNIYIGQSISCDRQFDMLYLRNLRLWQVSSMAEIAKLTHRLQPELKVPLQTTQLILAHSNPIDISFRNDERRFDVEGAYNIRYEIIKKRIDKVHVKETGQRLTQPGTISIVYAYVREMEEYLKYITFLQNKGVLQEGVETLELEDLQGVSGLKALRVKVKS
ncbi:GAF domain-containing protein [Chitinophaga pendula]|uniref:GAF domain-containing protein n=1 Tax=Chitinophaga TaxID=79328 RepID=UPI000BB0C60C|nr:MULTISPECIES: GAF domain-containing protein [Chitinophaga]ASZ10957.1 hypothetical protein CK934_08200 [Chitinophaga sp. MD30]UCJ06054.1 GAF domain-containing protein [Chitinophaga pendula]